MMPFQLVDDREQRLWNKLNPDGDPVPYMREEKSTIDAKLKFTRVKEYFETLKNIYRACYDTLNEHITMLSKLHRQQHRQQQVGTQ